MFIERQQHPTIEFDPKSGQAEPSLAHYFSDRADPFKTVLPLLVEGAGREVERVLVVTSPLSEVVDEAIRLHRHPDYRDMVVVDEKQRPFFDAVRMSLEQALAKINAVQFARMDDEEEDA